MENFERIENQGSQTEFKLNSNGNEFNSKSLPVKIQNGQLSNCKEVGQQILSDQKVTDGKSQIEDYKLKNQEAEDEDQGEMLLGANTLTSMKDAKEEKPNGKDEMKDEANGNDDDQYQRIGPLLIKKSDIIHVATFPLKPKASQVLDFDDADAAPKPEFFTRDQPPADKKMLDWFANSNIDFAQQFQHFRQLNGYGPTTLFNKGDQARDPLAAALAERDKEMAKRRAGVEQKDHSDAMRSVNPSSRRIFKKSKYVPSKDDKKVSDKPHNGDNGKNGKQ